MSAVTSPVVSHALLARLGCRYPIIQAPMAGVSNPQLVAAVSNAGGLGSLAIGAVGVEQAADWIRQTRQLTDRPFNVNLFCHVPAVHDAAREAAWLAYLAESFRALGAQPPTALQADYQTAIGNDALLAMLVRERPAVVSFHFGLPGADWIAALRQAGCVLLACVTSLEEAQQAEQAGVDVLVAQGAEAGGHRGAFVAAQDERIGTLPLVRLLATRTALPVVAAGGIMDGAGVAAALDLGAAAVQMGTAFILCPESSASAAYRRDLQSPRAAHTAITAVISGRPARGIVNQFHALEAGAPTLPDYPLVYSAGKQLIQAAARQGSDAFAAHWAGQGAPLARAMPAAELVALLVREWRDSAAAGWRAASDGNHAP